MPNVGPMELAIVLIIALIVLGPKKLPEVGRSLGKGMREFKDSVAGITGDHDDEQPREVHAAHVEEPAPAPVAQQAPVAPAPAEAPAPAPAAEAPTAVQ